MRVKYEQYTTTITMACMNECKGVVSSASFVFITRYLLCRINISLTLHINHRMVLFT